MNCSNCGKELEEGLNFCSECGSKVIPPESKTKTCISCGFELKDSMKFCSKCGANINETSIMKPSDSRITSEEQINKISETSNIKNGITIYKFSYIKLLRKQAGVQLKFYTLEEIKPDKIKNAINSYAPTLGEDETIIFHADNTLMGKADLGFILTTKRFYCNDVGINIEDIQNIYQSSDKSSINIVTEDYTFLYSVYLTQSIVELINQTVKILNS